MQKVLLPIMSIRLLKLTCTFTDNLSFPDIPFMIAHYNVISHLQLGSLADSASVPFISIQQESLAL